VGYGGAFLPATFERKAANASRAWIWQYVFHASGCPQVGSSPTAGDIVADRPPFSGRRGLRWARLVPVISLQFRASVGERQQESKVRQIV
jgi:hypothetical protein